MVSRYPFRIRPAIPEDVPGILDLIFELAAYEKLSAEVVATPERLRETLFGQAPAAECLLAEQGERVVGMAIFFTNYSTFLAQPGLYLEDLYVRDEQRGQGIGKALLTAVARLAVQRGCGRMEWSVLDWNQPAIDFYESLGASPQQEWTVYRLTGASLRKFGDA